MTEHEIASKSYATVIAMIEDIPNNTLMTADQQLVIPAIVNRIRSLMVSSAPDEYTEYQRGVDYMTYCLYRPYGSITELNANEDHNDAVLVARTKALANADGKLNMKLMQSEQYVEAIKDKAQADGYSIAIAKAISDYRLGAGVLGDVPMWEYNSDIEQMLNNIANEVDQ